MKIHHNRIFYVCFCFIILFINSCKAQREKINVFFNREKEISYKKCLDYDDDYKYYKKNNLKEAINFTESSCKAINSDYDHFSENTIKFLDSSDSQNSKQDFIILNKTLNSIYISKPVLTIFKAKSSHAYSVIHNYTIFDDEKERFVVLTDHGLEGYNADKILKLFEDYLYEGKKSSISENINNFPKSSAGLKFCYIISRIKGKFSIKKYYYLDNENYD